MQGLMMDCPLSIISLLQFAAANHGEVEITSRTIEGSLHVYTYRDCYRRVGRLANALHALGVANGDRIATLAWNGHRHLELYYGISGCGAVCHTINPRLSLDQIKYIINHARDKVIFVDTIFVPLLEALQNEIPSISAYVIMADRQHMPRTSLRNVRCYEDMIGEQRELFEWPQFDENTASSLCFSSGTTGEPKGTLYSHRSTVLHAYAACFPDNFGYSSHDIVLPLVPLFHVNAWGVPYSCPMVGAKLVFPGPKLDSASTYELLESQRVTYGLGVPTLWVDLLDYLRSHKKKLSTLKRITSGGSAVPTWLIKAYRDEFDIELRQGWGMTELSPICLQGSLKGSQLALDPDEQLRIRSKQGRPVYGVEFKIVDESGNKLPHDGIAFGELCVRGPWVLRAYYENPVATANAFDRWGWFKTGDVCRVDEHGFVQIVDRAKDLIKSGGEWISSIEIENAATTHPSIADAAAISVEDKRWGERPLLVLVLKEGKELSKDAVISYLATRLPKISVPSRVAFVDALPRNATGKILKTELRKQSFSGPRVG